METISKNQQITKTLNMCAFGDYLDAQRKRLPSLPDVQQISPCVIRVLGYNPGKFTLQGTNTYIVGTGRSRLLIDTGQGDPQWAATIASTIQNLDITLSYVLLTHWHGDHTGGVPDLIRFYPYLSAAIYKNSPAKGQKAITNGQVFRVEGATIHALFTPGHSYDHMCFILQEENAMFTGDNILGHGTSAFEDLAILMSSWREMQVQDCDRGYPGHGDVLNRLKTKIASQLMVKIKHENQIMGTLHRIHNQPCRSIPPRRESVSTNQLVSLMHGESIDESIRVLALEPFVDEILRKLAEEGNVGFEVRNGQKRWFRLTMP